MDIDLNRFIEAQETTYVQALSEIKSGRKQCHWMWFIFPQYKGLGNSSTSIYYSIKDKDEAKCYLNHPVLGFRLKEITTELLHLFENDAYRIFGTPDDLKLKSCMTLFAEIDNSDDRIFLKVLQKYFEGEYDFRTLVLMKD